MKKFISVLLIFTLLFTMSSSVFADKPKQTKVDGNQKTVITEVTEDEYIKIVSQQSGLAVDKVKDKIKEYKGAIAQNKVLATADEANVGTLGVLTLSYYQAITEKNFSAGTVFYSPVELGMAYTVYSSGSFRQINSIDATWTGATGDGLYTWSQYTLYTYPTAFPTTSIEAHTRGAVETQIDVSISGNLELKNALVGAGFSVSLQAGTTYYLRKVGNIDLYKNIITDNIAVQRKWLTGK